MSQPVSVECRATDGGWACQVTVGDDSGATSHEVTVSRSALAELPPDEATPDALVADSFAFLLAREPRESILRSFDLPVISGYFPGWEREVAR